ncbi:hypothetical protein KX928_23225 [Roseobacter sp. YSTF-M11]|uniref:Uncharacterized protein n=1 Tax=Roseobacter insulae TaxID=2859783 RepID=A0A9X1K5D2_9RHOB|nr:hypothetical protein [Roseobacter insulae]MBW4710712.1 hypothetical protein [Roseobacter insulae]
MSSHLTPLEVCERLVAPLKELGKIAGQNEKAAYAWRNGSQWRDPGDLPPRANRKMLKFCRRHDIPLTAEHLIWGASIEEVHALLDQMRAQGLAKLPGLNKLAAE